ncbi:MAG TPA: hypothetical protein VIY48_15145 [Candidatus Paceibacterota bacterium]
MKLVRDGYVSLPDKGLTLRKTESVEEHIKLLSLKMHEELRELLDEIEPEGMAIEAGDLIEAIIAYCHVRCGVTEEEVTESRTSKSHRLGGFVNGTVWVEG